VALGLASVLALAVTFGLYRLLRRNSGERPELTHIVLASRDLPGGIVLTADDVKVSAWPVGTSLPGSFSKVEDVLNRPLIYPVGAKDPILQRNLAIQGSGLGLSVKIPPGMRATSVRSNEVVGVAGFLYPGSRVDVLATFTLPGNANSVTQTILQDVEVLTAGEKIEPDPQGKPQTVDVVTLLLGPGDSQKLLLASTQGTIQFVLRNSADQTTTPVKPTSLTELVPSSQPQAVPSVKKTDEAPPRSPAPAAAQVPGLEVIRGNARSVESF
jgi:pilus assembly protein CpaB